MRHVLVALALALGPLGPAVCETVCADASARPMAAMPGCHMTQDADGPAVTGAGGCRHSESRAAFATPSQAGVDLGPVVDAIVTAPAKSLRARPASAQLAPSPPRPLSLIPLRR